MTKITMTDIAKAAGVSVTTVGRVIRKKGYVSEKNRRAVEEQIAALGYVPNHMARILKGQRSGIIGSLITHNANFLYEHINQSIIEAADNHGFELLTMEGRFGRDDEARIAEQCIGLQVEGLVIVSNPHMPSRMLARLRQAGIPVVAVERCYSAQGVDNLAVRDFEGAKDAVERIREKGHQGIALIAAEGSHPVERARLEGYRAAMEAGGLTGRECLLPRYSIENGYRAMEALLSLDKPPTAVFATADIFVCGMLQCLYARRIPVPEGISIAGYDNVLSAILAPQVDSVDLVMENIGEHVLSLLKRRIANPDAPEQRILIDTIYVDRGTVLPLPPK